MLKRTPGNALAIVFFFVLMQKIGAQPVYQADTLATTGGTYYDELVTINGAELTGVIIDYDEAGRPKFRKEIRHGRANGLWQEWYGNGFPKFRAEWKEGYGHGRWQYFYPNGRLRQDEYYDMDTPVGIHTVYYSNGQVKSRGAYEEGKKHGDWQLFSADGRLEKTEKYAAGELIGEEKYK